MDGKLVFMPEVLWSQAKLTSEPTKDGWRMTFTVPWRPNLALILPTNPR